MPPETVFLFYATFAVLCAAAIFKGAEWGVYLYVGMYFLVPWERWWSHWVLDWQWMQVVAGFCLVAFLIRYGRYRETRFLQSPAMVLVLVSTLVIVAFIPLAIWPERHLFVVDKQIKMLIMLVVIYKVIDTPLKFERLLWVYLLGMFYLGSVVRDRGRTGGGRIEGIGTIDSADVNDLSSVLVAGTPLLLFYALEGKFLWVRATALLALAYVLNAIILGGSRGAFVGLLAAAGAYLVYSTIVIQRSTAYRAKIFAGFVAAIGLFIYLADPTFWTRMASLFGAESVGEADDGNRMAIWGYAWRLALENPLGLGAHGFTWKSTEILPAEYLWAGEGSIRSVHSTYFEALTAYGFAGLALLLALIWMCFRSVRRTQEYLRQSGDRYNLLLGSALLSGFAGYLICAAFLTRNYHDATYYVIAFMAIYANIYRREGARVEAAEVSGPARPSPPLAHRNRARVARAPDAAR